jgi:hypothetical protein
MRDEVITDVDRQIQEALAVDPSSDFQARVRVRLSEEPQRYRLGMSWLVSGAVALAAVAVLAVFVSGRDQVGPRAPELVAPAARAAAVAEPPPPAIKQPDAAAPSSPTRSNATELAGLKRLPDAVVLVPAAEREALRRYVRTATENGLAYSVPREAADDAPLNVPDLTIEPIVIAPIDTTAE